MNDLLMLSTTPFLGTLGLELYRVLTRDCRPVLEMLCDPALDLKSRGPDTMFELYRGALGAASGWTPQRGPTFALASLSGLIQARLGFEEGQAHLMIKRYGEDESEDLEVLEVLKHQYTVLEWALRGNVSAINSLFILLAYKLQEPKVAKLVQLCLLEGADALEREALLPRYEVLGTFIYKAQRVVVIQDHEHHETFLYDLSRWCNALHYYLKHGGPLTLGGWPTICPIRRWSMFFVFQMFVD